MIDSSMSDRKRDYWGTIFNVVMGDDNSGGVVLYLNVLSFLSILPSPPQNLVQTLCYSSDEAAFQPALSPHGGRLETGRPLQGCDAETHEGVREVILDS